MSVELAIMRACHVHRGMRLPAVVRCRFNPIIVERHVHG